MSGLYCISRNYLSHAGVYRLSHREKALIIGASQDLRVGRIGNGNCVRKSSPEKEIMEDAENGVFVMSEPPQSGQKE